MQDPTLQALQQTVLRQVQVPARIHQEVAGQYDMPALQRDEDETAQLSCRLGDASCASAHSEMLNRAPVQSTPRSILRLQRDYGNRFVQRVVRLSLKSDSKTDVGADVEHAIQSARGGGQALDSTVRAQMEPAFGADFGGVRVHTDGQADGLNRDLSARAFTTGQDIFFRQGEYNPGSSGGRELLAHELTHVVQQNSDQVQTKLTLGQPGDRYEQEADTVAHNILQQEQQPIRSDDEARVRRQMEPEDEKEEPMQAKQEAGQLHRQVEEDDEEKPIQAKTENELIRAAHF